MSGIRNGGLTRCGRCTEIEEIHQQIAQDVSGGMLTTLLSLLLAAIIIYRLPWTWHCSKLLMKFIHAGLNLLAFILAVIAVVAAFDFHNTAKIPNMYSLHSWLGLTALVLYGLQVIKLLISREC